MKYPKISIVTPSFNQAPYLEKTILSVISQDYPNLEYIIIDGGSTDGSLDIIKKYSSQLTYWESSKDKGQYHAIQKGFEKSSGDIMAWINSDDVYHSQCLFTVAEIFSSFKTVQWLTGNVSFIDEGDRIVFSRSARRWSRLNVLNNEYVWIQQESTFWSRGLWEKAGKKLDLTLNYASDYELWIRFFRHEQLYTVETMLGAFRLRKQDQKTLEHMPDYMNEYNHILKEEINRGKKEKTDLTWIKFYEQVISKIPVFKRLFYNRYMKAYNYAPIITFDRNTYQYKLKSK